MSQPQSHPEPARADSLDATLIMVDCWEDATPPPSKLSFEERMALRQVVDSYSIHPDKLAAVKGAAIRLGRSKTELIREGLELVLEKYRDKLGDLANSQPPSDAPKPDNGPPSA